MDERRAGSPVTTSPEASHGQAKTFRRRAALSSPAKAIIATEVASGLSLFTRVKTAFGQVFSPEAITIDVPTDEPSMETTPAPLISNRILFADANPLFKLNSPSGVPLLDKELEDAKALFRLENDDTLERLTEGVHMGLVNPLDYKNPKTPLYMLWRVDVMDEPLDSTDPNSEIQKVIVTKVKIGEGFNPNDAKLRNQLNYSLNDAPIEGILKVKYGDNYKAATAETTRLINIFMPTPNQPLALI